MTTLAATVFLLCLVVQFALTLEDKGNSPTSKAVTYLGGIAALTLAFATVI